MYRLKYLAAILISFTLFLACNDDQVVTNESTKINSNQDFSEGLAKGNAYAEFEIKLENLTPATGPGASQPFSPPVMATHTPFFHIFKVHKYASTELGQLAEDAVNAPMLDLLDNSFLVYDIVEGGAGPIFPASYQKFMVKAKLPFKKFSLVAMLVNTNDAFTGIDGARLPLWGSRTYYLKAYDAGTEKNTELKANIPGPCCGSPHVRVPTHQRIKMHKGILGVGDLSPKTYGWDNPVAKLTVTRIK